MISVTISGFIEAALRSLVVAGAVWAGLRFLRVRNVLAQKAAWITVLGCALLMPLMLGIAARWPGLPAARIALPAESWGRHTEQASALGPALRQSANQDRGVPGEEQSLQTPPALAPITQASNRFPAPVIEQTDDSSSAAGNASSDAAFGQADSIVPAPQPFAWRQLLTVSTLLWLLYLGVAAVLLYRLLYGLAATARLWRAAEPVSAGANCLVEGLRLRASRAVSSPVTIGSAIVLPADYAEWDEEKLRIVLAHEQSHIRQKDFYLQFLASLYAALTWFSPLGWWLKPKLSDLGEAISDRSGLAAAADRTAYAQILLEFAAAPRPTSIGVAMARPRRISQRIERLLNDSAFRQAFTVNRRTLVTAMLVPAALFAVTALVRVEAETQAPRQTASVQGVQAPQKAEPAPTPAPDSTPTSSDAPASSAAPAPAGAATPSVHVHVPAIHVSVPARHIEVPAIHESVPAVHVDMPAESVNVPAVHVDVPAESVNVPAVHVDVPGQHIDIPGQHIDIPGQHIDVPSQHIDVPSIEIDVPQTDTQDGSGGHASYGSTGKFLAMLTGFGHALVQRGDSQGSGSTFDRTLSISGQLDLSVGTGSGNIHITRGAGNQIHIHGVVKVGMGGDEERAREIVANPPIEQTGNIVRIGAHRENLHNISISYDIEAPADAFLNASSGSGNIVDEGVGQNAKLNTGSGDIHATGLKEAFTANTGSGNIVISGTGRGDFKAQTGSGNIELSGIDGGLHAETGSGDIKVAGSPSSEWRLQTGSGSVAISPGNTPFNLDASTGSGSISTANATGTEVSQNHHHLTGKFNGGGPMVRIQTGSGSVHVL